MTERTYLNFDLVVDKSGNKYCARVINSPSGQASVEFDIPFSSLELENFVLRMGRPKRGMRRLDSPEMEAVKLFGTRLFQTVFNDDVYACYLRSRDHVLNQGSGLRIRLRINAPEFHNLPWEYLYNPQVDQFLALSKDTPVIRYLELPYTTQALPVDPPLKILVMISSPEGFPPLNIEEEWKRLNKALQPLSNYGLVTLEKLEYPTLSALQQKLRKEQIHIFHYIGHGKYFEQKQDGLLLLEDENHRGRPISGQHLGAILHDHHTLRLVILNACEGARTSAEDPYAGVAQTLIRQGIPAVLAMQFEIFEEAAIIFAQEFYSALVDNYPVDAALSEARKAIFAAGNDTEWGTPVLFTRASDGVLFKRIHYIGYGLAKKFAREESGFKPTEIGTKARDKQKEEEENEKEKAIRIAREREQLERRQPPKPIETSIEVQETQKQKVESKLWIRAMIILGTIIGLTGLCSFIGRTIWPFVSPSLPPTTQAIVFTQIPSQTSIIPVVFPTSPIPPVQVTETPTTLPQPFGKIVFTCQKPASYKDQICVMNSDGSNQRLITNDNFNNLYATFSPDGNSIVFSSNRTGLFQIYEMRLNGDLTPITNLTGNSYAPAISPDGMSIVFTHQPSNQNMQIWIVDRSGANPRELFSWPGYDSVDPTWSPDGKKILFAVGISSNDEDESYNRKLYTINKDGSGLSVISEQYRTRGRSDWSPNDLLIASYSGEKVNSIWQREIFLMNVDGTNLHQISNGGDVLAPSFSPDGNWIAFTGYGGKDRSKYPGSCEIYIMRIDGSDIRLLTNNDYCDYQPIWGN